MAKGAAESIQRSGSVFNGSVARGKQQICLAGNKAFGVTKRLKIGIIHG